MVSLLSRNIPKSLPAASSPSAPASSFLNFFNDKITNHCFSTPPYVNSFSLPHNISPPFNFLTSLTVYLFGTETNVKLSFNLIFFNLHPVTEHEVCKIILSSTDSSCSLDLIPTKLLKSCIDAFVPPITHLINLSLNEVVFPTHFKKLSLRF